MTSAARLLRSFALFNPHATFSLGLADAQPLLFAARKQEWEKWRPSQHPPHWYPLDQFRNLLAACLREDKARGRVRFVREFVAQFRGLSGSTKQKAVREAAGVGAGDTIEDVIDDASRLSKLLAAMQENTSKPEPKKLGLIGKADFAAGLVAAFDCRASTVKYQHAMGYDAAGVPWVLEVGFGRRNRLGDEAVVTVGLNWAPTLRVPFDDLPGMIQESRVDSADPVTLAIHLVYPSACALDRGKTRYELPAVINHALAVAVAKVTADWTKAKDRAARDRRREVNERDHAAAQDERSQKRQVKKIAWETMPAVYAEVAGRLGVAPARMMMYAARPKVIAATGNPKPWKSDQYYTQRLLPDFMKAHPELTASWNVVFDDRGHFTEPHTGKRIGIGTLSVRRYVRAWNSPAPSGEVTPIRLSRDYPTCGPKNRFRFALFIEKEGFDELIDQAGIEERYDIALMSTKGMTVTSARRLIESLSQAGVTILVMHDFDKSGLGILHSTYTSNRRYTFGDKRPNVIDLGIRLADVERLALGAEDVEYVQKVDPRVCLRKYKASEAECRFLVERQAPSVAGQPNSKKRWLGKRVELNALMTADRFIEYLESKLVEHGVTKLIPDTDTLAAAYIRFARIASVQAAVDVEVGKVNESNPLPPADLPTLVAALLADSPAMSWDAAVAQIAEGGARE